MRANKLGQFESVAGRKEPGYAPHKLTSHKVSYVTSLSFQIQRDFLAVRELNHDTIEITVDGRRRRG